MTPKNSDYPLNNLRSEPTETVRFRKVRYQGFLERAREIGVLRALGLTPREVWGLVTTQTGLIGLLAGILAVPCGLALAAVLIFVINRRSFGWTMPLDPSPTILLQAVALSVVAALLAGLYPAWRMANAVPAEALRDE